MNPENASAESAQNPAEVYRSRIRALDEELLRLRKSDRLAIAAKLVILAAGVIALYRTAVRGTDADVAIDGGVLLLFVLAAVLHGRVLARIRFRRILRDINRGEMESLDGVFLDLDDGREFADEDHPFSSDLDLFGPRSLFHLLNRTATGLGINCLAGWLKTPIPPPAPEIGRRQEGVRELASMVDIRHRIRAHGASLDKALRGMSAVPTLFDEPCLIIGRKPLLAAIHILPVLTVLTAALFFFGLHQGFFFGLLLVNIILLWRWRGHCARVRAATERGDKILGTYAKIVAEIEGANFQGKTLRELQQLLTSGSVSASRSIRRLSAILGSFDLRRSILYGILNLLLLWDLRCVYRIEKWRASAEARVPGWFRSIAEMEALASLANLFFNNPDWAFPEIVDGNHRFQGESLGTPLLPRAERVTNDFKTEGQESVTIITGPNMAGKSTFLKTVGVNLILAFSGAPACASRLIASPARLMTSMKVSDSLDKGMSLFYAELSRLKMILDPIRTGERVYFLVDEMLKGTNALDRQKGSMALLRQLAGRGAAGLIATHDLQLTGLETEFPGRVVNYHFDGFVAGDQLLFDYKLKKGPCQSFNALLLMRKMGIEV